MNENQIYVIYGDHIKEMTASLLEAVDLKGRIPSHDSLIGLKPNLVVAKPSSTGATTTTEIVEGVIEYLQKYGYHNLLILEGSWVGDDTGRAFKVCGYDLISKKYGVPLFDTKKDSVSVQSYGRISMEICNKALETDFLIDLPVLKGHCQTYVTGALKNMKGCISDREKRHFHTLGLHRPIAYLNKLLRPDFVVADGICGDLDFEEGGNPVRMNRIFAGSDPVLTDSYIASCMGYRPADIEYIRIAADIGVGSCDIDRADIIELNRDTTLASPASSRRVQSLAKYTEAKDACSACYANLIQALARMEDCGELRALKGHPVKIGQKYQNSSGSGPGVGRCASGFKPCCMGCPPKTEEILKMLRAYRLRK